MYLYLSSKSWACKAVCLLLASSEEIPRNQPHSTMTVPGYWVMAFVSGPLFDLKNSERYQGGRENLKSAP